MTELRGSLPAPVARAAGAAIRWGWSQAFRLGAIGPRSRAARRFGSFGEGSFVAFPQAVLYGERYIHLGERVAIGPYVALTAGVAPGQELVLDETLVIGDDSVIGRGCAIAAHFQITIGRGVYLAPEVFVCDQGHDWTDLDLPIGRQFSEARPVQIGDGSWLGHGVIVLPGVTIGRHVAVGAGSIVTRDLPDYSVATGAPAVVTREHDPERGWIRASERAARDAVRDDHGGGTIAGR